jgi:adenylate kinase
VIPVTAQGGQVPYIRPMATRNNQDRIAWLQGTSARCGNVDLCTERPWRLVLLGAPGAGKGTQADLLNRRLHACHLSTGDVFRAAGSQHEPSPAMKEALAYMRRGELVPDATVWSIVSERSNCLKCAGGFILDGFPRTLGQAVSLQTLLEEQELPLHAVINYTLPANDVVVRLGGRRTCEKCKTVYHMTDRPPKAEGRCDRCDGKLFQREDDRPESIQVRLEAYHRSTTPLIEYYDKLKLLVQVDASGSPEEVFSRTVLNLGAVRHVAFAREMWVLGQE